MCSCQHLTAQRPAGGRTEAEGQAHRGDSHPGAACLWGACLWTARLRQRSRPYHASTRKPSQRALQPFLLRQGLACATWPIRW